MAGVTIVAADTESEARRLFTSHQQSFLNLRRGHPGELPPPVGDMHEYWNPNEQEMLEQTLRYAIVGTPETVARRLATFVENTNVDEVIVTGPIYDHAARLRSFEIVTGARAALPGPVTGSGAVNLSTQHR